MCMCFHSSYASSLSSQDSAQHVKGSTEIKPKMPWCVGTPVSVGRQNNLQALLEGSGLGLALHFHTAPQLVRMLNMGNALIAPLQACEQFVSNRISRHSAPQKDSSFGSLVV